MGERKREKGRKGKRPDNSERMVKGKKIYARGTRMGFALIGVGGVGV